MDFNIWHKIRSLEATPNKTAAQEERLRKLNAEYSTGKTHYTPLMTYPTSNTRVSPEDVIYKSREDIPKKNINMMIDYEQIARNNQKVRESFPKKPLETERHYVKRLVEELKGRKQNLDLLNEPAVYNPTPTANFFTQVKRDPKLRVYTTLDIETDDYGRPISVSASRLQWNKKLKDFVAIDSFQRFYPAKNTDLLGTFGVHGMTSAKLLSLRDQQKAKYSLHYNEKEEQALREYLGDSIIIGHNIIDFDLNRLFPKDTIWNSTIDTLKLARSIWKGKPNALHNVFYRLYGKTMEEMGLPHHDPNADTIASAMIAAKLFKAKGIVGASLRYIQESIGAAHIAEWDSTMDSMVTVGNYRSMYNKDNLFEVFMSRSDIGYVDESGNPIGTGEELSSAGMSIKEHGELLDADMKVTFQQLGETVHQLASDLLKLKQDAGKAGKGVGYTRQLSPATPSGSSA